MSILRPSTSRSSPPRRIDHHTRDRSPLTDRLGLKSGAFDIMAACAGFCYSVNVAADSIRAGSARNVLVVGAERITDRMDWNDRNTCYLFGDGAGAAIISATDVDDDGIGPVVWGSDGALADYIAQPMDSPTCKWMARLSSSGQSPNLQGFAREACEKAGIEPKISLRSFPTKPTCASSNRSRATSVSAIDSGRRRRALLRQHLGGQHPSRDFTNEGRGSHPVR